MPKLPFELGIGHYDEPPPDHLDEGDLENLRVADRFREANELRAWIEVEDGKIVEHGQEGRGPVGSTTFRFAIRTWWCRALLSTSCAESRRSRRTASASCRQSADAPAFPPRGQSVVDRDLMKGTGLPERRKLEPDETLVEQGAPGDELFLLLDGVLVAEVDGEEGRGDRAWGSSR
jgi:hypothetical protein